jgi:hypothetical protein
MVKEFVPGALVLPNKPAQHFVVLWILWILSKQTRTLMPRKPNSDPFSIKFRVTRRLRGDTRKVEQWDNREYTEQFWVYRCYLQLNK